MATLRLEHVSRSIDERHEVGEGAHTIVDDVSFEVADGELLVLVGPSGCGKSTLLRLLSGLEEPQNGRILLDSADITHATPRDRDVAMVFQSYALYPHLTVRENLAFALKMRKTPPAELATRVDEAAKILDITQLLSRKPSQLSGGQRQRVAMGRAIVRRPKLFLFDEPLSNLDAALRGQMRIEILRLHRRLKTTTIYVTHDQVEAMTLGDRIVVMRAGTIQQIGRPRELYDAPRNLFVAKFIGTPEMNVVPAARATALGISAPTTAMKVGFRAEDLLLTPKDDGVATVEVVEPLGGDALVHLVAEGNELVAQMGVRATPAVGTRVSLAVAPDRLHAFDERDERIT